MALAYQVEKNPALIRKAFLYGGAGLFVIALYTICVFHGKLDSDST
jgi:hypothetical protein